MAAGRAAIASLQPLVNLTRLTHRTGDPHSAYQELYGLHQAVRDAGSVLIHSRTYSFDGFTTTTSDRAPSADSPASRVGEQVLV